MGSFSREYPSSLGTSRGIRGEQPLKEGISSWGEEGARVTGTDGEQAFGPEQSDVDAAKEHALCPGESGTASKRG